MLALRLLMLALQRRALTGEVTGSCFGQLHRGLLAGHQLTQIGHLRLALLCGAAQLVQRLPYRGQALLAIRALFGGLVEGQAHVGHGPLHLLRLSVQFRGTPLESRGPH